MPWPFTCSIQDLHLGEHMEPSSRSKQGNSGEAFRDSRRGSMSSWEGHDSALKMACATSCLASTLFAASKAAAGCEGWRRNALNKPGRVLTRACTSRHLNQPLRTKQVARRLPCCLLEHQVPAVFRMLLCRAKTPKARPTRVGVLELPCPHPELPEL